MVWPRCKLRFAPGHSSNLDPAESEQGEVFGPGLQSTSPEWSLMDSPVSHCYFLLRSSLANGFNSAVPSKSKNVLDDASSMQILQYYLETTMIPIPSCLKRLVTKSATCVVSSTFSNRTSGGLTDLTGNNWIQLGHSSADHLPTASLGPDISAAPKLQLQLSDLCIQGLLHRLLKLPKGKIGISQFHLSFR